MSIPLGELNIDETLLKQALESAPLSDRAKLISLIEELKRRQTREFAQQNFLAFVQQVWPSFIYGRHHARMAQEFEKVVSGENKRLIINLGPRHAVQIDEPIPTPEGWTTMKDLQVGDLVFGSDGVPTHVIGKSEVFHNRNLYRVTTDDGHSLDVDGEHLWTVRMKRGTGVFRDYTTEQLWLRQQGVRVKASRGGGVHILEGTITAPVRLPMLPTMYPAIHSMKELLIDPYVLGVWLGDGASAQSHITSHDDDAVYVRAEFERRGYVTTDQKTKYLFGVLGLKVALRELGVLNNKHIPEIYLSANPVQRRDLLKGLMDSDGNVTKKGQCFFAQKSLGFITQVRELLCSLGIKNSISNTEAKIYDKSYGLTYRLSFYASDIANLPRKEERTLKTPPVFGRYIKVEKLNVTGDVQCIKVDREDGLFLAGKGYICTHNTKSEFGSYLLPAWYLGKYPEKKIIQCSHTAELAVGFGRKVRNLVGSAAYQEIFPGVDLQIDSKAAGRWNTTAGGSYFAIGVSGAVTGIGGDIIIIDDPHSEQEAAIAASNPEVYDKVYEWYTSGPRQRLQPGGGIIIVQCMTGDTPILMGTGEHHFLKDIRVGDVVATYNNGKLDAAKVLNWQSNGVDKVWKIRTTSGTIVRANERHPFLVDDNGERKWIRLKELKVGMLLVKLKGVIGQQDRNVFQDIAPLVKQEIVTIEKIQMPPIMKSGITANIKEKYALKKVVKTLQNVKVCAPRILVKHIGHQEKIDLQQKLNTQIELKADTELPLTTLTECPKSKEESAQSVTSFHHHITQERTGTENFVSTIATILEKLEDCFATIATSLSDTQKHKKQLWHSQNISKFTLDEIVEISFDGEAEVFDVEIEGTENFIANSLVSHNTRWSKRDLTGQVRLKESEGGGDKWRVVELPAILPSGKPLWPEFWSLEELEATRNAIDVSKWQAQYQQDPTSEEGAIIKREWWQRWESDTPPPTSFVLQAWDTAFEKHNRADYSACTTWGVFNRPNDKGIDQANIILLDAKRDRLEFPQLKEKVLSEYRYWEPDSLLIEKKASGAPLIYELRHMGIVVSDFTPTRGNDKISRLNAISDIFASGRVWAPNTRWADEVIEEVAAFPAGQHDDYCFVAGTKILMSDGSDKNIEDIVVGDEVWSHLGAKKVLASGYTGEVKTETLQIGDCLDVLEGTGDHLIYSNNGWKKLTNLNRKDNIVKVSINKEKLCHQNLLGQTDYHLNLTGQPIKNITTDLIGKKLEEESFYTEMCGNTTTEKYLKVIISIILMVTKTTMISLIFKLCPQKNIGKSIEKRKAFEEKLKNNLSILKKLDICQQNGMVQKKVARGMLSMLKKYLEIQIGLNHIVNLFQWKKLALFVEQSSYLKTQQNKNIAQINAQAKLCMIKNVLKYWLKAPQIVSNVAKRYTQSIVSKDFAMEYVEVLSVEQKESLKKVYNITVEDSHTYYANGILVHNCDTLSMAMMRFRQGGFISTALDREDEEPNYRRKTSSSYY